MPGYAYIQRTKAAVAGAMTLVRAYRKRRGWTLLDHFEATKVHIFVTRLAHRPVFEGIRASQNSPSARVPSDVRSGDLSADPDPECRQYSIQYNWHG